MGSPRSGSGPRVLVVEDEPLIAFDLEDMLTQMGCVVIGPAPTVYRALELLARKEPDFAILDVNLRRERATPVAEALRARRVPFALATALNRSQVPEAPWREAPLLGKPIDRGLLRNTLADLTNRSPVGF